MQPSYSDSQHKKLDQASGRTLKVASEDAASLLHSHRTIPTIALRWPWRLIEQAMAIHKTALCKSSLKLVLSPREFEIPSEICMSFPSITYS